ncbi:MAG: hypothetical protein II350_05160 [Clostridia bacterium]|nr:hypothetical protein [Clostridia bacterium]
MKSEDILNTLSDVKEEYIAEASVVRKKKTKKMLAAFAAVAACLGLAVVGTVFFTNRNSEPNWPVEEIYMGTAVTTEATYVETELGVAIIPTWDERKMPEKFNYFEFDGKEFSISHRREEPLAEAEIGQSLGEVTLSGYDIYTDQTHETSGEVFEIRGISKECALGIRFEGDGATYVYMNRWYSPATLADFAADLNFEENLTFGGASMHYFDEDGELSYVNFEDFEDSAVWDMLLSDGSLENMGDVTVVSVLTVSVSHELLGYENMALCICEDGTVWTNILGMMKSFFVGKEKTDAFIDWVIENVPGKRIVYVYPETDATETYEDTDMGEESVVSFTSSGYIPEENVENEPPVAQSTYTDENGAMISPPYDPSAN